MPTKEIRLKIRVLVEKDEGMLMAYCPDLPGLAVEAENMDELHRHVKDAVKGYIESLLKHGDSIPIGVLASERDVTLSSILNRLIRKLTGPKQTQYIEEINFPYNNQVAA